MLQFIRSKAGSLVVKILFALLIACFGLWGVGDFLRQLPGDTAVIQVGATKIKPAEVQAAVDRGIDAMKAYFGGSLDRSQAKQLGIVDRAVDELIDQALFDQEIERLNLSVGEEQIAEIIQSDPTFHGKNGQFDRALFDALLTQHKMTETQYMGLLQQQVPRQDLLEVVAGNVKTPDVLTALLYRKRAEKRVVDYVFLDGSNLPPLAAPDDKTLRDFYTQNLSRFTAPEYRRLTLVTLTTADVIDQVTVSDDKLQDYYQQNLEEFSRQETRDLSHMLLPDEATAKKAEAALAAGKSFDDVAQSVAHQDADTVKLGAVTRSMLPTELAGPAFSTAAGRFSAPIKSELGWSILRVNEITPAHTESFDDAKPQLIREAKAAAAGDALYQLSNKVEDAIAAGADLGAIAQQFNLKPVSVAAIDSSGKGPDGSSVNGLAVDSDTLTKVAFQTQQGQLSPLTETKDGKFFMLRVDAITPATPKPFPSASAEVAAAWAAHQKGHALADAAASLASSVTATESLSQLAAAKHLPLGTTQAFARDDAAAASPLPTDLMARVFDLKLGQCAAAAGSNGGVTGQFVVQLRAIQTPDPKTNPNDVAQLAQQVGKDLSEEFLQAFNNSLRTRFPVKINQATLDTMF